MKPRIGIVLSGCGAQDGSEIHEATLTLLALDRADADILCMAPDRPQADVVDHLTGNPTGETRNVLRESARIARGRIQDLAKVTPGDLDGVVLPGGYGAAKNLCNCAEKGADATVHPEVFRLLKEMAAAGKPIGAICIAPALVAVTLGEEFSPKLTIGNDPATAAEINRTGSLHVECPVTEIVVDREHKIVSTPAYMLAERISESAEGIEKLVREVINLI